MDMGFFSCRKSAFFQAPIKLAQPFPAPELQTNILRTRGFSGIIERGVPQAYVRARASSATPRSVHVLRVSLCNFDIKKGI